MAKAERVVVVGIWYPILGGAERQAIYYAHEINRFEGYRSILVYWAPEPDEFKTKSFFHLANELDVEVKYIKGPDGVGRRYILQNILFQLNIRKLKPYLIVPFLTYSNIHFNFLRKINGARISVWNERCSTCVYLDEFYLNPMVQKAYINADFSISNSSEGFELTRKYFGTSKKEVFFKNLFYKKEVSLSKDELKVNYGIEDADFIFSKIGNITPRKDHMTVVESFSEVIRKNPDKKIVLLFAGYIGKFGQEIVDYINKLGLQKNVKLLGPVEEIEEIYTISDATINSSPSEGSPNCVIESIQYNTPAVVTDIRAHKDLLGKKYPYFFKLGDTDELAKILEQFVSDKGSNWKHDISRGTSGNSFQEAFKMLLTNE